MKKLKNKLVHAKKKLDIFRVYGKLFGHLDKSDKIFIIIVVIVEITMLGTQYIPPILVSQLLERLVQYSTAKKCGFVWAACQNKDFRRPITEAEFNKIIDVEKYNQGLLFALLGVGVAIGLMQILKEYLNSMVYTRLEMKIKRLYYRCILRILLF